MNFKSHLLAGTATSLIVGGSTYYINRDIEIAVIFAIITIAGSLISDLDTGSIPSRIFAGLGIATSIYLLYIKHEKLAAIVGIVFMAFNLDHHRGITHKWILPIVCFILGALSFKFPNMARYVLLIPFGFGLSTHFIIDKIPPYKII